MKTHSVKLCIVIFQPDLDYFSSTWRVFLASSLSRSFLAVGLWNLLSQKIGSHGHGRVTPDFAVKTDALQREATVNDLKRVIAFAIEISCRIHR